MDRCTNTLEVRMEQADAAALDIIATDVLDPQVIARTLDKLMKRFDAAPEDAEARRIRITATQQKLERELANIQSAVAAGTASETLLSGIRDRERQHKAATAELAAIDAAPALLKKAAQLRRDALRMLEDWKVLLGSNVPVSRQLLRKLIDRERFTFYPKRGKAGAWFEVGVTPTLDRFFDGLPLKKSRYVPKGIGVLPRDAVSLDGDGAEARGLISLWRSRRRNVPRVAGFPSQW